MIIRLNIGGFKFDTTLQTLLPCAFFQAAFITSHFYDINISPAQVDEEGRYFIDRDGQLFIYILSWLRTGQILEELLETKYKWSALLSALDSEADFYGLDSLKSWINEERAKLIWRLEESTTKHRLTNHCCLCQTSSSINHHHQQQQQQLQRDEIIQFHPSLFTAPIDF
jgi:hypothetical protein